jgi:NAD(P)-dependent dehydrogenase (short-subunit alcohol dehydrogenase family)
MTRLANRHALVTGSSRGIGRAIALGLAREGADVVVNYRSDRAAAEAVVQEITKLGRRAMAVSAATQVRTDVERLVAEAERFLGQIDLLVNNAGILKRTPILEITEDEWDQIIDVNLKGYFLVGQTVARRMVERKVSGSIVNVGSSAQTIAVPNATHYAASKAGVAMLTKQMALELAPYQIRVNAVAPGLIETDMNRKDIADPAFLERRMGRIPLKRVGGPEDVVGAVVLLSAHGEAGLITGASLAIDGGVTIS